MRKGTRGFTLVEVIVSIAALAMVSGFILQFFLVSDQLNRRAGAVDSAWALAASIIEEYKGQASPALDARPGSALEGAAVTQTTDGYTARCAYDEGWRPVAKDDPAAAYDLVVDVTGVPADQPMARSTDGTGEKQQRGLYAITVEVRARSARGRGSLAEPLLVSLTGKRYFVWMEGGAG